MRALQVLALAFALAAVGHAVAADADVSPRDGKYLIYTYGAPGSPPIYLGYFILAGNSYRAFLPGDKPQGDGRCAYHADRHALSWDSGPYAGVWQGDFTVEREGKTHKIRLKSNTVATNSTDS